ncbi:hypothetical protein KY284_030846 [Solanum tuberosum]|nr:hypothetical protein KY284_030846 [Solanum tuberosum]
MAVDDNVSTSEGTNTSGNDTSSALYVHPSDSPGMMLVPAQFDGTGYRSWRRGVMRALSVKNKLGFIDGSCEKPNSNSPQLRQWQRCDDMVTSWVLNSLIKEISDSVEYVNNSAELWKELEDRYDQTNGAKLYQIQKEINDLAQGILDITVYYTRMKKLWEELNTLSVKNQCSCVCVCGAKDGMHKAEQDRRLIQFLMGLNEVYTVVRGNILMMNPLPSMGQAFSLLIQEEKQREFKPIGRMPTDSISLNANSLDNKSHGGRTFRTNYQGNSYAGGNSNYAGRSSSGGNYYSGSSSGRNAIVCDYCKRTGHTRDKCYKLHGYPQGNNNQNFRSGSYNGGQSFRQQSPNFKGKRVVANVYGAANDMMNTHGEEQSQGNNHSNVSFTKEQYGQIMNLLQHFQNENVGEDAGANNASSVAAGSMNFAGIVVCSSSTDFGNPSCKCFESSANLWIIDSGASNHITFNRTSLINIRTLPFPILVSLPNGYKVKAPSVKRPQQK